jgi:hypothetical protein
MLDIVKNLYQYKNMKYFLWILKCLKVPKFIRYKIILYLIEQENIDELIKIYINTNVLIQCESIKTYIIQPIDGDVFEMYGDLLEVYGTLVEIIRCNRLGLMNLIGDYTNLSLCQLYKKGEYKLAVNGSGTETMYFNNGISITSEFKYGKCDGKTEIYKEYISYNGNLYQKIQIFKGTCKNGLIDGDGIIKTKRDLVFDIRTKDGIVKSGTMRPIIRNEIRYEININERHPLKSSDYMKCIDMSPIDTILETSEAIADVIYF